MSSIHSNYNAMFAARQMGMHEKEMSQSLERLSSGYRINSAADDPAGLGISERMRAEITGLQQAQNNALAGMDMLDTAEGSLIEVHTMLNRLVDIADRAATGTTTEEQRGHLQREADEIIAELRRTASATNFNGIPLLDGNEDYSELTLQIGTSGNAYDQLRLKMPNLAAIIEDLDLDNFDVTTQESAQNMIDPVNAAIERVSEARATIGAQVNRLESVVRNLGVYEENLTDAESRIRDVDVARETMRFARADLLHQAAQAMMAHAIQQQARILELLRM
ncbi:flagellin [Ruminococcaceae bacterium OttesenSCG-928-I18]|nr:flagellin [Ruminococcaceae bacterium OttesenSCG-928-I18]